MEMGVQYRAEPSAQVDQILQSNGIHLGNPTGKPGQENFEDEDALFKVPRHP